VDVVRLRSIGPFPQYRTYSISTIEMAMV
jgi:hypothetical protein